MTTPRKMMIPFPAAVFTLSVLPFSQAFLLPSVHEVRATSRIFSVENPHDNEDDNNINSLPPLLQFDLVKLLETKDMLRDGPPAKFIPLMHVYNAAETAMTAPFSMEVTTEDQPLPTPLAPYRLFVRSYDSDRGHDGRFPLAGGSSFPANALFSMDDPLTCLQDVLSWASARHGGITWDQNETVVCLSGLHSSLESSTERLEYASTVLDGLKMASLHIGTHHDGSSNDDDTAITVELTDDIILSLTSLGMLMQDDTLPMSMSPTRRYRLKVEDLNHVRAILSWADLVPLTLPENEDDGRTTRIVQTLVTLIDVAVESSEPLVLLANSGTCFFVSAAIETWKRRRRVPNASKLLREAVTVVTLANICRTFPDGPAYIHVSMLDDPLTNQLGVTQQNQQGGGNDAVYLHALSPWTTTTPTTSSSSNNDNNMFSHDAHNMDAGILQFLYLILRINGLRSFRHLYRDASVRPMKEDDINPQLFALNYQKVGNLEIPPHLDDELLPSLIRATGGERWLWNPELQLGEDGVDGYDSPLPDLVMAEVHLLDNFGYSAYEEIYETCCHPTKA